MSYPLPPQQGRVYPVVRQPIAPGSRGLGATALILALVALIVSLAGDAVVIEFAGEDLRRFFDTGWFATTDDTDHVKSLGAVWHALLLSIAVQGVATVLGIVGGIMGIVAAASDRGRALGIAGLVIALAAPIVSVAVFVTSLQLG